MGYEKRIVEQVFRRETGRVLASLIADVGDFELAQDALQDAYIAALEHWPRSGVPTVPAAWLLTTARRKAIDRLRRVKRQLPDDSALEAVASDDTLPEPDGQDIPDERLKLMFTCCHPALATEAQIALTLNTIGGLSTREIARAFLVSEVTMAQRLVRAKRKIRDAGIPYAVPPLQQLSERLDALLAVLYLIFNEGYNASTSEALIRQDLCQEALRLTQLLATIFPDAEALGLLALMFFQHSRRRARVDADGQLVLLEDQERNLWDADMIADGTAFLQHALRLKRPGVYQLQAAIAALHAEAPHAAATDWAQIAALYGELLRYQPSPVIALNRAVAVAMSSTPAAGLRLLDELERGGELAEYHLFYAARADLLRRDGQTKSAQLDYQRALDWCTQPIEQAFLRKRLTELGS